MCPRRAVLAWIAPHEATTCRRRCRNYRWAGKRRNCKLRHDSPRDNHRRRMWGDQQVRRMRSATVVWIARSAAIALVVTSLGGCVTDDGSLAPTAQTAPAATNRGGRVAQAPADNPPAEL